MIKYFYEFKKAFFHFSTLLFIVIFLFLNAFMCQSIIERQTSEYTKKFIEAHKNIYQNVEGKITKGKVDFVISEKNRLNDIVLSGEYNTNFDLKNTYTGYIFSDNNLIDALYDDIYYSYNYSNYSKRIKEAAKINSDKYLKKGNTSLSREYIFMSKCFDKREIFSFYSTMGWDKYFTYSFSNLLIILIIIVGCSSIFSKEKECGMSIILHTTFYGKKEIAFYKILASISFSFLIVIIFSIEDFIIFDYNYSLTGFFNPIYSIREFKTTGLNMNIIQYVILNFLTKYLGTLIICNLVIITSSLSKSDTFSLLCNFFIFFIHIFVYLKSEDHSILSLMNIYPYTISFNTFSFAGIVTHKIYWMILLNSIILIFLELICFWINVKPQKNKLNGDIYETDNQMGNI